MFEDLLILGIVGSRKRTSAEDAKLIKDKVKERKPDMIVSGGCDIGADHLAEVIAKKWGIPIIIFYPKKIPKGSPKYAYTEAFYARNKKIADTVMELVALPTEEQKKNPKGPGGTNNTIQHFRAKENFKEEDLYIL